MPDSGPHLTPSVITSSSPLPLGTFFEEVLDVHPEAAFDLMILRHEDAVQFDLEEKPRITDLVAERLDIIQEKLSKALESRPAKKADQPLRIPALATYFPDVSSMNNERREAACKAIVNCVKLFHDLQNRKDELDLDISPACVEIVCGSLLEPVEEPNADKPSWVLQYTLPAKIEQLVTSLKKIEEDLENCHKPYALSLEVEPGPSYVLSDGDSLLSVYDAIRKAELKHVGLNLDIAHFKIAGISPSFLKGQHEGGIQGPNLTHWIVHSHIADHPLRMHTRDLSLGAFSNLEHFPSDFCGYLDLLMDRAVDYEKNKGGLLFSGAVALELEGCGRVTWIHDSIGQLKRLLHQARRKKPTA